MPSVSVGSTGYNVTVGYSPSLKVVQQAQGIPGPAGPAGDSFWEQSNSGIYTTGNVAIGTTVVGSGSTVLWVEGDARITGILSVGQGTVTIDGNTNTVNVDNLIIGNSLTGTGGVGYATTGYVDAAVSGVSTFSGDYNDLTNKPTIPSIVGLASEGYVNNLVAISTFSGDYNDLINQPTNLSSFSNDVGFVTSSIVVGYATEGYVDNLVAISTFSGDYNDLINQPSIPSIVGLASEGYVDAAVSGVSTFSGDYNDLTNKPTIPSDTGDLTNSVGFVTSSVVVGYATEGYVDNLVAISTFSGDYNDLTNTPTALSSFSNDVGFVTSSVVVGYATETYVDNLVAISTFSGDYNDLINQPTNLSSFSNDVGFATVTYVNNAIANLVDSAPSTLDTLNELSAALGDDPNFATTIANTLASKANLSGANFTGVVTATSFVGDLVGTAATSNFATTSYYLNGQLGSYYLDYNNFTNTPSNLSSFSNDVGFVTSSVVVGYATEGYVDNLVAISTFSGDYNDLINQPTIPSIVGLASEGYVDAAVSGVSTFSGDYNDLTNKPTNLSSFSNDVGFITTYTETSTLNDILSRGNISGIGISVGVVTATSFSGSGVNLTGIVTSIVAGTNITISGSTGEVTINSSGGGGESISPFLLMGA